MAISIDAYDPQWLEPMLDLYNREAAYEGHIAPLTPERFVELVERKACFDPAGLFVARDGGAVVGWTHVCVSPGTEKYNDPSRVWPQLRMLVFPRERMDVGHALVAAATAWMRPRGKRLLAMSCENGYPLYRGLWMGGEPMGPATMPHVQVALEVGGFKTTAESVFLVARMDDGCHGMLASRGEEVARTKEPVELTDSPAEMATATMADSWVGFEPWTTRLMVGGQKIAEIGWVVLPQVAERLGAPVLNIWMLGVQEAHRRKGFASALVARALRRGVERGARFATLGTQVWNAPAQATYARFGFHPHCILTARAMDVPAGG